MKRWSKVTIYALLFFFLKQECTIDSNILHVYIMYTPSHVSLKNNWFLPTLQDSVIVHEKQYPQECLTGRWMSPGWTKTTLHKIELILDAINEQWGSVFVYSDVDIQFFAPFTQAVITVIQDKDIVFQKHDHSGTVCTGFFACRANERTRAFFEQVKKMMQTTIMRSDQPTVNVCLKNNNTLTWDYLPESFFAAGCSLPIGQPWSEKIIFDVPNPIIMHHANCTIGVSKKKLQLSYVRSIVESRNYREQ